MCLRLVKIDGLEKECIDVGVSVKVQTTNRHNVFFFVDKGMKLIVILIKLVIFLVYYYSLVWVNFLKHFNFEKNLKFITF